MKRKMRERISAGDNFIKCAHVELGVLNPKVYLVDMTKPAFDHMRQLDEAGDVKWVMLCETCAHSNHGEAGFPYTKHRMPVELNVEGYGG